MAKRLLVVGSINLDLVATTKRVPRAGETVAGTSFNMFPGGKGANQAFAAARLGTPVSMIGKLGNDTFGILLRKNLEAGRVATSAIDIAPTSSGIAQITTSVSGENTIVVVAGANAHLTPRDLDQHLGVIRESSIVLTQLEIPLDTVEYLAVIAEKERIPLVLDPAPAKPLPESLLKRVEWLTPNETETSSLLGLPARELSLEMCETAADALLKRGSRNVLLKLGNRGCYLALSDGTRTVLPAYSVNAVDTTAAGDAFNGAFAAALLQGKDPVGAATWASAVAAISVTRRGAQPSMPTQEEVYSFLGQVEDLEQKA
jgi:ribokinase